MNSVETPPATLRALLERGAAERPSAVVLTAEDRSVTWARLRERACRVAAALVRDGIRAPDRVIYVGRNDARFFEFLFGCALAGAVPTPVNWRLAPAELAAIVSDSGARLILADDTVAVPSTLSADPVLLGTDYEAWLGPPIDPGCSTSHDDIALQLYTSGTTGRPKGAMFDGRNVRMLLGDIAGAWGLTELDVSLVTLPLFHMGGLAWALAGLARGARIVVVRDFDPAEVLATMTRERVSVAFFVPTMLAALCAVPDAVEARTIRRVFYSGAPIGVAALTTAIHTFGAEFVQLYGLTEATGAFAQLDGEDHDPGGPRAGLLRSAGRPYPWVEVRVVEPGSGENVAPGEVGEIWTRSAQNLVGYWGQPAETARALTDDGWLRTGDLGRLDDEGRIFLVDRAKDLVISGGENVYPVEVENVLAEHPELAEVAVIGVPDARWGETVKAVVVPVPGAEVDTAEVIAFARERLAGFKCPTSVDVVASLPRTATGKVRKPELREPYWQDRDRRIH